ncbi:acetate--CoA ligase family protein [Nocardioides campestrisoli]|uniref:acetate--CoA ligase family protein n=1 Tax=Nocardioides campestrisoli TaxID=2736757 RepID=UPI0015E772A9|nr:acetate--CoA ligase family protein [Nocardioides campestrisoli]
MIAPATAAQRGPWTLTSLLNPSSVAIVGASDNLHGHTGRAVANLLRTGYAGRILPVNPRRDEVQGLACYPSVTAIPDAPECAYLLVRAALVPDAVRECARAGVRTIVVCSSGFAEEGDDGRALQAELAAEARAHGARLLGPNCIGVVNPSDRFVAAPTFNLTYDYVPGGIAVLSQSGGVGVNVLNRAQGRSIGVRAMVSLGNEADLSAAELLDHLVDDEATSVVALVLEQLRDVPAFAAAVERAHAAGKPVLALKLGTSDVGARSSQGHTGAMAGSHAVFSDIVRRLGVLEAATLDELLDTAHVLDRGVRPRSNRVLVISPSGGECTYLADRAVAQRMELPDLGEETKARLARLMRFGNPTNPLDLTGQVIGDTALLEDVLTVLDQDPAFDAMVVGIATFGAHDADRLLPQFVKAASSSARPTVFSAWTARHVTERAEQVLQDAGVPWLPTADRATAALSLATRLAAPPSFPVRTDTPTQRIERPRFASALPNEAESKRFLATHGLPVSEEVVVDSLQEALPAAERLGWPVVAKQLAGGVLHKSDLGLVKLGLRDPADLGAAWHELATIVREHDLDARGVLLARTYAGVELIVGATRDPVFGPVVMVGSGGILAELVGDRTFARCPVSVDEAREMVSRLRVARLLDGYRGKPHDTDSLAAVVARLSEVFAASPWLAEVDLNPVLVQVSGAGATVVDAALVCMAPDASSASL